jgi:catechol 2,3-dioxygenase-like lactoylglutathione lyase family enzyme
MIGDVTLGSNDLPRAIAFYEALFETLGAQRVWASEDGVAWSTSPHGAGLGVVRPYNGKAATFGNGTMVALTVSSREQVDALHAKALTLGGTDEGAPGERFPGFYTAYFRDLDGNKLNAFFKG